MIVYNKIEITEAKLRDNTTLKEIWTWVYDKKFNQTITRYKTIINKNGEEYTVDFPLIRMFLKGKLKINELSNILRFCGIGKLNNA